MPEEIAAMGAHVAPTLMHPDDLARFSAHLERVRELQDTKIADFERRMRDKSGEWHWFHSRDVGIGSGCLGNWRWWVRLRRGI